MNIKIDVYYRNKKTGKHHLIHEEITEDDIEVIAKDKTEDSLPMWMDEEWEFDSVTIDELKP